MFFSIPTLMARDDSSVKSPSPFSRVPTEIKAVIAALAAQQDQAYQRRTTTGVSYGRYNEVAKSGVRIWDGRSVNALFCVSREWHALAAPHVFKTIDSKRCGESFFMLGIATRYASLVKEAIFSEHKADSDGPRLLLAFLCNFVNLRRVSIHHDAFLHLLGAGDDYRRPLKAEQLIHRTAFLKLVNQGLELSLEKADLAQLSWICPQISGVRHLDVLASSRIYDEEGTNMRLTSEKLRQITNLEHLSLHGLDSETVSLLKSPGTSWGFGATLRSLEVRLEYADLSTVVWKFVASFSATLERLVVASDRMELSEALSKRAEGTSRRRYPMLRYVAFNGSLDAVKQLLSLVVLSPLRAVALNLLDLSTSPEALLSLLQHLVDLFPSSLRQVGIDLSIPYNPNGSLRPYTLDDLTSFATRHQFALTISPHYDSFYESPECDSSSSLAEACAAADETLRFGLAHSARLLETEDFEGAKALLDLLVPLKGQMLREKD